jgi:hypothetical protein
VETFCRTLSLGQVPRKWKDSRTIPCYQTFSSLIRLRMPPLPRDRRLQRESTSGVLRHEEIRPFVQKHFGDRMVSALKLDFYQISNPSLAKFAYAFSYSLLSMLTRCRYVRPLLLLVPKESNSTRVSFVTSEDAFESSALANMKVECRWDAPSAI